MKWTALAMCVLLATATGCGDDAPAEPAADKPGAGTDGAKPDAGPRITEYKAGDTELKRFGDVYLGGQPSEAALGALKDAGVRHVVCLRTEGEDAGFDEQQIVQNHDMRFHNPAFGSADELTDPVFLRLRDLLSNKSNRPLLLHCASGNRVGAVWLAHRVLDDGVEYQQALDEAKKIGLKSQALEDAARAYIESNRGQ